MQQQPNSQCKTISIRVLEKPAEGKPCNGCGFCCMEEVCLIGKTLGDDVRCRALTRNEDGSFSCGMLIDPISYMPKQDADKWNAVIAVGIQKFGIEGASVVKEELIAGFAAMLGAGKGCDSDDEEYARRTKHE